MPSTLTMRRRHGTKTEADAPPSTAELDKMADWLDTKFSLFGVRFGVDSLLGVVPVAGDAAGFALSSYLIFQGYRMGARKRTLARMAANVAGDTVFGSVPVLGTVLDVFWKANTSNMKLLRSDLDRPGSKRRR